MRRVVLISFICVFGSWTVSGKNAKNKNTTVPVAVRIESVPFSASLVAARAGALVHYCGASVVHDKFVITAASCFVGKEWDVSQSKVLVGTSNLQKGGELYEVDALIPHEKYFKQTGDYNVGLVKLKQRLAFSSRVGPVGLGRGRPAVGSLVDVVGWGSNANHSSRSSQLLQVSIPVLRPAACKEGLGRIIRPRDVCAGVGGEGRGDCVSDEGGPVFKNGTLIGVATPYTGCGRLPGLYTSIGAVRGWVTDTIDHNLSYLDYFDDYVVDERKTCYSRLCINNLHDPYWSLYNRTGLLSLNLHFCL